MFKKCLNKDVILKRKINSLGGGTSSRGLSKEMGKIERRSLKHCNLSTIPKRAQKSKPSR